MRLYEIALDVGARSGLLDAERALELRLALARALRGAGDVPAARARCEEVLAACRRTPDSTAFARAALDLRRAAAGMGPHRAARARGPRGGLPHGRERSTTRCAPVSTRGSPATSSRPTRSSRASASSRSCEEAAAAARRAGAAGALAIALMGTHYVARGLGMRPARPGERLPTFAGDPRAAEAGGEHEYAAAVRYSRAMNLLSKGEPEAFASEIDGLATAAVASRAPDGLWLADAFVSLRATVQGRFAEAEEARDRALATGIRMQLANALGVYVSQRIMLYALQGRLAEIAPRARRVRRRAPVRDALATVPRARASRERRRVAARAELQSLLAAGFAPAERGVMSRTLPRRARHALRGASRSRARPDALRARRGAGRRVEHGRMPYARPVGARSWARSPGSAIGPTDAVRHFEVADRARPAHGIAAHASRRRRACSRACCSRWRPDAAERAASRRCSPKRASCAHDLGLVDVAARVARLRGEARERAGRGCTTRPRRQRVPLRRRGVDGLLRRTRSASARTARGRATSPRCSRRRAASCTSSSSRLPRRRRRARVRLEGLAIDGRPPCVDDAPDERARRAYRARIDDLRAELEEAEEFADTRPCRAPARGARAARRASSPAGSGTRARRVGPAETARKAVTKVIRTQIGKLLELHPPLGRHLSETVRMGTVCVYAPPTRIDWDVAV